MTNREMYDINCLELVSDGDNAMIYYYPKHTDKIFILVAILFGDDYNGDISEGVVKWLDSEYTKSIMIYNNDCF